MDDELLSRVRASGPRRPILTGRRTGGRLEVGEQGLRVIDAHLVGVDASGLAGVAGRLDFSGCVLEDCDFSGSDLGNVLLSGSVHNDASGSVFRRCDFTRADLRLAGLNRSRFEECRFAHTELTRVQFLLTDLVGNTFSGQMQGNTFWGRPPRRDRTVKPVNEVTGNDFTAAEPVGISFTGGVPVRDQRWPDRDDVVVLDDLPARARRALAAVGDHTPQERRVRMMLTDYLEDEEQRDYVFFRGDPGRTEARRVAVDLLLAAG